MHREAMIECEGLTRRFGEFTAVDHVTFNVEKGSIFGFLGPNGSGKSTVIRMLCGLLAPSDGRARIGGHDVVSEADSIKGLIGYMSQAFSLYDELTVHESLQFFGQLYGLQGAALRERYDELFDLMHFAPFRERRVGLLSGGWRQRVAMACAMMHKPRVLFLDEPTAGIDPVARRELWDMLFDFSSAGMTLFVTTHYMDEAERCSNVGYIYMSRLIVCGEPEDLKALPEVNLPDTRRLEVICDHVTVGLKALRGLPGVINATVFGQSVNVVVRREVGDQEILNQLRRVKIHQADIRPIAPSLEDVFVTLTASNAAGVRS